MLNNANTADVYTDFNGLSQLKKEAKKQTPEAIKEVARQFESVFIGMVLKSMRAAKLTEGGLMDNDQSKFYQDMHDQQLSIHLSGDPGIGLADVIERQLSPKQHHPQDKMTMADYRARPVQLNKADEIMPTSQPQQHNISSKEEFVQQLRAGAEQAAKTLGVEANVLLAQAALETGWGKSVIKMADGSSSHNLFNIKAHHNWAGKQVAIKTLEFDASGVARQEKARFRAYDSYQDSFNDYVRFIKENPRYHQALQHSAKPEQYMHELQSAGYATDPAYADKVMRIYHDDVFSGLQQPDVVVADAKE